MGLTITFFCLGNYYQGLIICLLSLIKSAYANCFIVCTVYNHTLAVHTFHSPITKEYLSWDFWSRWHKQQCSVRWMLLLHNTGIWRSNFKAMLCPLSNSTGMALSLHGQFKGKCVHPLEFFKQMLMCLFF